MSIAVQDLTKRFGATPAVAELTFSASPGEITGFLGPNGSGKTTTMRMLLGLVRPDSGTATIDGLRYAELPHPVRAVGAVLDGAEPHPACSAREHLRVCAAMARLPRRRVDEVLEQLEMTGFAGRPSRGYSTGMRRRLSLATALLGDPPVLVLDEPGNGLDPRGMAWLRDLLTGFAAGGRTVLVSSHVLSELEQIAGQVVVIRDGRLVATGTVADLSASTASVALVRSPDADELARALGGTAERIAPDLLRVRGIGTAEIADRAAAAGLRIHELTPEKPGLEQVFLALTAGERR
ncbi:MULTISPECIES: ABC transporter ATP-binding protein [Amycolatopsis]|uniref:ATP-binding cassette domain-containing protein n=1 Tax=Amycolatopsis dendrobii TaxID=2760662 RepID=A0A7W3ZB71_9PSEU|nr:MULTISPECIES: ATP-binding cassette domain-containing protein [Amycolatopsis]MBB1154965.1 ATP-binding cassette domain-containing protein [Amycolatopsis dendrobii]UKD56225.1 ATP-binding cassette domain-containing protein [Amycolatopsis sp. FU40]